jgi:hypothetical protein
MQDNSGRLRTKRTIESMSLFSESNLPTIEIYFITSGLEEIWPNKAMLDRVQISIFLP